MQSMITNIAHASKGSHVLAVAVGVIGAVGGQFLADPHVAAYIHAHWWMQYVVLLVTGLTPPLMIYYKAQTPLA